MESLGDFGVRCGVRLREGDLRVLEAMGFGSERKRRVHSPEREIKELKDVTVELPYHPSENLFIHIWSSLTLQNYID